MNRLECHALIVNHQCVDHNDNCDSIIEYPGSNLAFIIENKHVLIFQHDSLIEIKKIERENIIRHYYKIENLATGEIYEFKKWAIDLGVILE